MDFSIIILTVPFQLSSLQHEIPGSPKNAYYSDSFPYVSKECSGRCDMHPEHILLIHMTPQSESYRETILADCVASTDCVVSIVVISSIVDNLLNL